MRNVLAMICWIFGFFFSFFHTFTLQLLPATNNKCSLMAVRVAFAKCFSQLYRKVRCRLII